MDEPLPTVGFIGLGRMGLPMCRNLLRAGYPLVVHNRTAAKAESLVATGATLVESPTAVARAASVVITCLDTLAASEQVFLAEGGVIAAGKPGTLLVDHGTISPTLAQRIGEAASTAGMAFLDAPVSGGPEGAEKGTLAIMVGGSQEAYARALPVMRAYGRTIIHMGPVGSGTHAKLVNQLLTFVHGAAAAEAIAIAKHAGLDLETLAQVLRASFGHSKMLDRTLARVQEGNYEAGAALRLFEKDLGIVQGVGDPATLPLPVTEHAITMLRAALDAGHASRDIAALALRYAASE